MLNTSETYCMQKNVFPDHKCGGVTMCWLLVVYLYEERNIWWLEWVWERWWERVGKEEKNILFQSHSLGNSGEQRSAKWYLTLHLQRSVLNIMAPPALTADSEQWGGCTTAMGERGLGNNQSKTAEGKRMWCRRQYCSARLTWGTCVITQELVSNGAKFSLTGVAVWVYCKAEGKYWLVASGESSTSNEQEFTVMYTEDLLFSETANALHIIDHRQRLWQH